MKGLLKKCAVKVCRNKNHSKFINKKSRCNCFSYNDLQSGAKRVRTADLLTASQALSQLSYSPEILKF